MAKVFSYAVPYHSGSAKTLAAAAVSETCFLDDLRLLLSCLSGSQTLPHFKHASMQDLSETTSRSKSHHTDFEGLFFKFLLFFPGVKASPFVDLKFRKVCEDTVKDWRVAETGGWIRVDGFHELLCVFYLYVPLAIFLFSWFLLVNSWKKMRCHENSLAQSCRAEDCNQIKVQQRHDVMRCFRFGSWPSRLPDLPRQKSNATQLFTSFKWKGWNAFRFRFLDVWLHKRKGFIDKVVDFLDILKAGKRLPLAHICRLEDWILTAKNVEVGKPACRSFYII